MSLPRIEIVRDGEPPPEISGILRGSAEVAAALRPRIGGLEQEFFVALLLDAKHRVKKDGYRVISVGTLTASIVHPREVFRPAIHAAAAAVILGHNHPSSDPAPSPEDINLTRRLREAGEVIGIRVLDHIIIGDPYYYSFADADHW